MNVINITINTLADLDKFYYSVEEANIGGTIIWIPDENGKKLLGDSEAKEPVTDDGDDVPWMSCSEFVAMVMASDKKTTHVSSSEYVKDGDTWKLVDEAEAYGDATPEPSETQVAKPQEKPAPVMATAKPEENAPQFDIFGNPVASIGSSVVIPEPINLAALASGVTEARTEQEANMVPNVLKMAINMREHYNEQRCKVFLSNHMLRSFAAKEATGKALRYNLGKGSVDSQYSDEENRKIDELVERVVNEGELVKMSNGYIIPVQTMVKYGKGRYTQLRYDDKTDARWVYIIDLRGEAPTVTIHNNGTGTDTVRPYSDDAIKRINRCGRFVGC